MRDIDRRFGVAKGIFSRLSSIVKRKRGGEGGSFDKKACKCLYDKVSFLNAQKISPFL